MKFDLLLLQVLNGLQYGLLLFLLAAGLTLVLGIMNFVNLAHGVLFMLGAYLGATILMVTGSFTLAVLGAIVGSLFVGLVVERLVLANLYQRDHLIQVLATFGLIVFFNEAIRILWGTQSLYMRPPEVFAGAVEIMGIGYPAYRVVVIAAGVLIALGLHILIHHTRIGMLIRAGATNAKMVSALGVNIQFLNMMIFGLGAALAGLAGVLAAPIVAVQPGMGDNVLIIVIVVIVIGGIGSIRGALYAAMIVGLVDTVGRTYLPSLLRQMLERSTADAAGPALASMLVYLLMIAVLAFRPQGLFQK